MDRLANEWYIMQRAKCKTVDQTYEFLAPGRQGSPLGEQGRRGREEERKEETGEQGWHFLISPPTCALGEPRSIEGCTEYLTMPPITGYRCITMKKNGHCKHVVENPTTIYVPNSFTKSGAYRGRVQEKVS